MKHATPRPLRRLLSAGFLLALSSLGAAQGPATLTVLEETTLARGQRLVADGSGFGPTAVGAQVLIGGAAAWISHWSDTRVHAYVPEDAPFGSVDVQVVTAGGSSNTLPLVVTPRKPQGRQLWRMKVDQQLMIHRPAVGPDGTIYAKDTSGDLFALDPDGGIRWLARNGPDFTGSIDVGPDGTIYLSEQGADPLHIVAYAPDGTKKWAFPDFNSQGVLAGPNVGPDGNVYVVTHVGGLGAYSLAPDGSLRWVADTPYFSVWGQLGVEWAFADDRAYVGTGGRVTAFDFDGNVEFTLGLVEDEDQVAAGPQGQVYFEFWKNVEAHDRDGNFLWDHFSLGNSIRDPDVGPDGRIYTTFNGGVYALTPGGSELWDNWANGDSHTSPIVSPTGGSLVVTGVTTTGYLPFIQSLDLADGSPRWRVDVPFFEGTWGPWSSTFQSRPRFSHDGSVVYVSANGLITPIEFGFLYAYQAEPIADIGQGLAGAAGEPLLTAQGPLTGGSTLDLFLAGAAPGSQAYLVLGQEAVAQPLVGGVLLPKPQIVAPFTTDGAGAAHIAGTWPDGMAPESQLYAQIWVTDPSAPQGFSASNGLSLIAP